MSSDLPRRNRFSLFRAKRLFFRPLRPFVFRRPRPLFRPAFPPAARSASVCNLISAMRDIALPHISLYISIPCIYHLYRVLPFALRLFDHAAIISGSECIYRCPRMLFFPCEDVALPHAIYLRRSAPYHVLRDRTWTIAYPRVCRPRKVFVRPTDAQVYFPHPRLSAHRRAPATLPRVNVTRKTFLRASAAPSRHG